MNSTHRIRIRGPWQFRILQPAAPEEESQTVTMPRDWTDDLGRDFQGVVEYSRFFNRPTNIDASTKLTLVFEQIIGDAEVTLNGEALVHLDWPNFPARVDVSGRLQNRNQLIVRVTAISAADFATRTAVSPPSASSVGEAADGSSSELGGGMVGEVRLEIG